MLDTTLQAVTTNKDIKTNYGVLKAGTIIGGIKESSLKGLSTVNIFHVIMNFRKGIVYEYGLATSFKVPTSSLSIIDNCFYKTTLGARMIKPKNMPNRLTTYTANIYGDDFKKIIGEIMPLDFFIDARRFFMSSLYFKKNGEWFYRVINADKSVAGWINWDSNKVEGVSTWSDFAKDITNVTIQQPLQAVRDTVETIQKNSSTFLGLLAVIAAVLIFKK